jgi:hypothetical protein
MCPLTLYRARILRKMLKKKAKLLCTSCGFEICGANGFILSDYLSTSSVCVSEAEAQFKMSEDGVCGLFVNPVSFLCGCCYLFSLMLCSNVTFTARRCASNGYAAQC